MNRTGARSTSGAAPRAGGVAQGKGESIAGYQVLRLLGRGAGSTLLEVRDPKDGRRYTLKRVVRNSKADDRFIEQLRVEHDVSVRVVHPAIRRTFRIKRVRSLLSVKEVCLVMEYIDGVPLSEARPESMVELVKVFRATAGALWAMEQAGYIHADVKPSNILIDTRGKVRLIDLGQSCPVGTVKSRIQGTPDYIAPEQVKKRPLTPQTDMFNLGATMYWCLTGRAIPTLIPRMDEHGQPIKSRETFHPIERLNPQVPYVLNKLARNCLRTRPPDRPESWKQVVEQLDLVLLSLKRSGDPTRSASVMEPDSSGPIPCMA